MKVVSIEKSQNNDAIEMLESAIESIKAGKITAVGISWVDDNNSIGGDISRGGNQILMWASLEHSAKSFYKDNVDVEE
jgi:hypothetical protein